MRPFINEREFPFSKLTQLWRIAQTNQQSTTTVTVGHTHEDADDFFYGIRHLPFKYILKMWNNKLTNETRMSYSNTQSRITSQSVEEEDDEEIPELIELN